jgi:hypothetical protein
MSAMKDCKISLERYFTGYRVMLMLFLLKLRRNWLE